MPRVINATEARIHFGELLHRVAAHDEMVIVERSGVPQVVVMSVTDYRRLAAENEASNWREHVLAVQERVREELSEGPVPPPEEIIRRSREERDEHLAGLR